MKKQYKDEEWEISVNKNICVFVQKLMQSEEQETSGEILFIFKWRGRKYLPICFTWDLGIKLRFSWLYKEKTAPNDLSTKPNAEYLFKYYIL